MRTTVNLDDDVAAAVEQLRRERGLGISTAINELARRGLTEGSTPRPRFVQRTSAGGARVDLTDIASALDLLEGSGAE